MRLLGQPEVVAAAGDEGPAAAVSLRRVGDECQLPTLCGVKMWRSLTIRKNKGRAFPVILNSKKYEVQTIFANSKKTK